MAEPAADPQEAAKEEGGDPAAIAPVPQFVQIQPNPFNPRAAISFELPEAGHVRLEVFDASGRLAARLVDGMRSAGRHEVMFDGSSLSSGVYFSRLSASGVVVNRRMVLLK